MRLVLLWATHGWGNQEAFNTSMSKAPNIFLLSTDLFHFSNVARRHCWDVKHMPLPTKPSPVSQASCQSSQSFSGTSQNIISKEASITTAWKHVGFFNKGNTCYANSIRQTLSVLPSFLFTRVFRIWQNLTFI